MLVLQSTRRSVVRLTSVLHPQKSYRFCSDVETRTGRGAIRTDSHVCREAVRGMHSILSLQTSDFKVLILCAREDIPGVVDM